MPMAHGISGIEHIALTVRDLNRTADYLRRLGFTVAEDEGADDIANLQFKTERIELRGGGRPSGRVEAGLLTSDLDRCRTALEAKGWTPSESAGPGRSLVLDTGPPSADVEFQICTAEPGQKAAHANGARALGIVTAVTDDPESMAPWAEKLFGESAVVLTDDTMAVFPGHSGFLFVTPDHLNVMFPEFELGDLESGQIAGISVLVEDIARTAAVLEKSGAAYQWGRADGVLHVPGTEELNLLLEFTTRDRFGSIPAYFD